MTLTPIETELIKTQIVEAMKTVYDPEIPVDIYELGLIYDVEVDTEGSAIIRMTLTSPGCPVAGSLPGEVESKARAESGAKEVQVDLVWEPPWSMDRMSDAAKLQLGML
jgi:FeS assembly SUF system protein